MGDEGKRGLGLVANADRATKGREPRIDAYTVTGEYRRKRLAVLNHVARFRRDDEPDGRVHAVLHACSAAAERGYTAANHSRLDAGHDSRARGEEELARTSLWQHGRVIHDGRVAALGVDDLLELPRGLAARDGNLHGATGRVERGRRAPEHEHLRA